MLHHRKGGAVAAVAASPASGRHARGVFKEPEYNGHIAVNLWLSTGERLRFEYPARFLTVDEMVRLHRYIEEIDPTRISLVDASPTPIPRDG